MKRKWISLLLVPALLLALFPAVHAKAAASGACGENLHWSFDEADGALTITGSGEMAFREQAPWNEYRERIKTVRLPYGLTDIADAAFSNCAITSVTIPESVTSLGDSAFYNCGKLKAVTVPDSVTAIGSSLFEECQALETATLPKRVTSFGVRVFSYCTALKSVRIPEGVERIGLRCFSGCRALEDVLLPASVKDIGEHAFDGCGRLSGITIPAQTETIDNYAFENCAGLTSVIVPAGVTRIGYRAFAGCEGLESMAILNPDCALFDGLYTAGLPAKTVVCGASGSTVEAYAKKYNHPFRAISVKSGFADVAEGSYCVGAVAWAVKQGITRGIAPYRFSPDQACTRAQVVTFLWRAMGSPEPETAGNPFVDVKKGAFCERAVRWAVEQGITKGIDADRFGPDRPCTRGQVVTFLWRAEHQPKPGGGHSFTDVRSGAFYEKAVVWAVEKNIARGTGAARFSPDQACTRGQIVTFLYRDLAE